MYSKKAFQCLVYSLLLAAACSPYLCGEKASYSPTTGNALPAASPLNEHVADELDTLEDQLEELSFKRIASISISGNNQVTQEALLARIPYRINDVFNPAKTGDLIRNLYDLNYFNNVTVDVEDLSESTVSLHITVEEKKGRSAHL